MFTFIAVQNKFGGFKVEAISLSFLRDFGCLRNQVHHRVTEDTEEHFLLIQSQEAIGSETLPLRKCILGFQTAN